MSHSPSVIEWSLINHSVFRIPVFVCLEEVLKSAYRVSIPTPLLTSFVILGNLVNLSDYATYSCIDWEMIVSSFSSSVCVCVSLYVYLMRYYI